MNENESKVNEWLSKQTPQDRWELAKISGEIDLSRLDEIDWATWQTAFGNGSEFPALVRASSAPYDYREPLESIFVDCHCIDELFPICIPTLPYLIQLLAVNTPDRQFLILSELWLWMLEIRTSRMWTKDDAIERQIRDEFISHKHVFAEMAEHDSAEIAENANRLIEAMNSTLG